MRPSSSGRSSASSSKTERKVDDAAVAAEWTRVRDEIIRPALDRIADAINAKGHSATVTVGVRDGLGAPIEISFLPAGSRALGDSPYVRFDPPKSGSSDVQVYTSTQLSNRGGSKGPRPKLKPAEITAERVNNVAITIVEEVFAPKHATLPENEPSRDW